jgi:hypothetical protein
MDLRIKNALGIVGVIAIALIAIATWNGVGAFSRSATAGATFSVSGQGKSVGVPDVAQFSFSVTNEGGKDIGTLQKDNTTKTNEAIAFLKSSGVDAKDIETMGYDIQPRYQSYNCRPGVVYQAAPSSAYANGNDNPALATASPAIAPVQPCPPASIVGYTVTQTVQVKVRDFSKTGDIIAGVTAKGANSVSGLNFTTDDSTKLQNEARSKAIQNAREQAEMMAKAGGFTLGRLISVNEGGGYVPMYKSYDAEMSVAAGNQAAPAPSIEPGSQQMNAQVTLTYEIK